MGLARVVTFDGVSAERMEELKRRIDEGGRPDDVPASEIIVLHDAESEKSLVVIFFGSDADYARGAAALEAMPDDEVPGQRSSVTKYEVAARMTA